MLAGLSVEGRGAAEGGWGGAGLEVTLAVSLDGAVEGGDPRPGSVGVEQAKVSPIATDAGG